MKSESEVAQCPTLCDPVDCSPAGSCIHGIFQARILEWVAISFSELDHTTVYLLKYRDLLQVSFIELDKAVVRVITLTSFL